MTQPVVNEKDRAAENGASRSQQRVVGMQPERYQKRCYAAGRNHSWTLEGKCRRCGVTRIEGAQRAAEWRLRNANAPNADFRGPAT